MKMIRLLVSALLGAILTNSGIVSAQTITSQWLGDGSHNQSNGNWSATSLWSPNGVPNNSGPTVYDVTIAWNPTGTTFNGPQLDTNITIHNLALVNLAFLDNQGHVGTNLSVTGSTTISTTQGHDLQYAAVFNSGGTFLFGTLTNYNSTTHAFNGPFFRSTLGGTIGFRGADIVTNNGVIHIIGSTSRLIDQDTNANGVRNLAVNNGGLTFADGYNFTTVGNFANNGGMTISTANGVTTVFTITGSLANYDAGTHTLTNGSYDVEVTDVPGTATLRFPGADIRTLFNAYITLIGSGSSIQDLAGQNALRNLQSIQHGALTNSGTQVITPPSGTFINSGATHNLDTGANITIQGSLSSIDGAVTNIGSPTDTSDTSLHITGSALINGGSLDMGGQPGVNTQYHTMLQVINGIEFRGAFLTGTGTTFADTLLTNGSIVAPGHSPGQLEFHGGLTFDSTTKLQIQISGYKAGSEFDQVVQSNGLVTLGGTLELSIIDGFENFITNDDTFDIVTSSQTLAGSFNNVASGTRLTTADGIGSFVVTYAGQNKVTLSNFAPALNLTGAASRKTHGGIEHDIPLALTGTPTVECRNGGGNHKLIFTFVNEVVSGSANLTTQTGGSISGTASFSDNTMIVDLTGVTDRQTVTVTLNGVTDSFAQVLPTTEVKMSTLIGDTSGNGTVTGTDVSQTKFQVGHPVTDANCREDVVVNGSINSTDVGQVKLKSGNGLPAAIPAATDATPAGR
jgi:hypothetical protein